MKNKIYKLLSIVLTVMLIFSCCSVGITALAEEVELAATYYISATGSDDTGTGEIGAPFLTVGKAITQATTDGHNVAGKTVAIHVTNEAADTSVNMLGSLSAANCDLIIYADAAQTVLYNPSGGIAFSGTGSLTFKNIYLYARSYANISFGNKNVSFDSGSKLAPGVWGGYVSLGLFNTNSSTTTPLYFTMNGVSEPIYLCDPESYRNFRNPLYITYDGGAAQTFYFGCARSDYDAATVYSKPVNFNLKSASSITFGTAVGSTQFTGDGLIQVINSTGKELTGLDTIVKGKITTLASSNATFEADDTPVTKWIINNTTTEYKDVLSFTDTAGIYDVAEGYSAVAVKADDDSVVVASAAPEDSQDVVLDLSEYGAGTYNVTVEKLPETVIYFVASATDGGLSTNDGLSADYPLLTINEAIAKATTEGLTSVDTLEVRIVGSNAVTSETHTEHDFKLAIKGNDPAVVAKLSGTLRLGGDTDFENITVSGTSYLGGYNVNFGTNATLATTGGTAVPQYRTNKTYPDPIDIYISKFAGYGITFRDYYGGYIYAQPVTVEVDNWAPAMANERDGGLTIGGNATYGKITYNAPLNIKLNSSTVRVVLKGPDANNMVFGENAAFQLINSTGKVIAQTGDTLTRSDGQTNTHTNALDAIDDSKEYILHNESGDKDLLDFTSEVGTYKVNINTEVYNVLVNGEIATITDGCITVPSAGTYTITKEKKSNLSTTYYVSAEGNDSAAGTEAAPLLTIEGAINKANAEGYDVTDTVYVKVLGTTGVLWKTYAASVLPKYNFTLDISSATSGATVGAINDVVTSSMVELNGTTKLSNIKIANQSGNGYIGFGFYGNDVELGDGVTFGSSYVTYQAGVWNSSLTADSSTYTNDQNIIFKSSSTKYLYLGNNYGAATFNGDINVTVDHASANPLFYFGCSNAKSTFNGLVNFNFKQYSSLTLTKGNSYEFGENAAVQIINSSGKEITSSTGELANITAPKYILTNNTDDKDLIGFTDVAGVYSINGEDTVYAYKDGVKVEESADGTLDLSALGAGEYILIKTRDAKTFNYTNADGATIADMIDKAISNGAIEGDTLRITLTGTDAIEYGTPVAHLFDVEIVSAESTPVYITNNTNLAGDTTFDGVVVKGDQTEHSIAFDGHNVTFTATSQISGINNIFTGNKSDSKVYDNEQNVVINCSCSGAYLYASCDWGTVTYKDDLNITLATWAPTAYMGVHNTTTYEGTVNIKAASGIKFANNTYAVYTGGLNVISDNALSDYTYLNGLSYDVYTVLDPDSLLGFGDGAGKFTVNGEDVVRAIGANGYADSADGILNLTTIGEGQYTLGLPHVYDGEETEYADYIDYRTALNGNDALNNFAAKVKAGEDVNVVYYGGSVTAGAGASNGDTTSWRGIISNWLKVNAPQSTVTNVNSAIGGTGSHFGFYRLDEAVLANDPDLLFIEFSINDYYDNQDLWNIDEDKAAMQMESIVRKVRTEAPDCDIVIVLTTDRDQIASLKNSDTLHKQARGHYKIAEKYGIPTLRVGHALADTLSANWADNTYAEWYEYVTDIVHPNDKGYQIYAGVVKEFMANSLLGDRNENAVVTNHTVPSNIVSEEIWAGDPVFIQANADLNAESAELGGYGEFTVAGGREYPYHTSTFRMDDPEKVLKFKFTGTELSILDDQYSTHYNGVNVKIDGGEEKYVEFRNYKPTVLASGLENVEHTAEVRIADENAGGGHWVYGFFVRNEADNIEKTGSQAEYYVSASAAEGGDGLTDQTPFATVDEAIAAAVAEGYGARDEITVKLIGTDTINWRLVDGALNTATTNYGFKLYVESNDTANLSTVHMAYGTVMGGDTEFNNVKVTTVSYYAQTGFWANGHDIIVGDNVTYNPTDFAIGYSSNSGSFAGQNVVFKSKITTVRFYLGNNSHFNSRRYTEDVNITIDHPESAPKLSTNVGYGPGITYYEKNLNLNIQDAASISVVANNGKGYLSVAGAIQVYLNNPNTVFSDDDKANLAGCAALSDGEPVANKIYYITNNSGIDNVVEFVPGETGKLKVNVDTSRYIIYVNGEEATVTGGRINLGSEGGDFSITASKKVENLAYYVSAGGSDETGDGSLGAPYATVMKAVEVANAYGLLATDSVTVNVIGTDAVQYGMTDVNYAYPLTIQSVDPANKGTVYFGRSAADNGTDKGTEKFTTGDTIFNNITVTDRSGNSTFHANGYNITMGEGTVMNVGTFELSEQQKTHTDEQTIVIKNAYTGIIHTSNGNYSSVNYNEDVNIIIDNEGANPTIGGTSYWGGGVTTYEKNLNVIVKQAAGLKFSTNAKSDSNGTMSTVVSGAVNLLVPSSVTLSDDSRTNLAALTSNVYEVVNALGSAGTIEFAGETGQYTVNVDSKYNAYVTDEQGASTLIEGTALSIDAAGKYIVSATRKSNSVTYYAQAGGTGDGSSAESPLGSVNAAIEKAIAEDWNYEQFTVTVKVVGTDALPWGGVADAEGDPLLTAHNFTLVIDSETEGAKVGNNASIGMGGNISIDNVQLCMSGTSSSFPAFALRGHNAVFGENVTSDGSYWNIANGRIRGGVTYSEDQYVVVNSVTGAATYCMTNYMSAATTNADVHFTYNAPGAVNITFASQWGTSAFDNNVFIDIAQATSATFATTAYEGGVSFGEYAKVQVIDRVGLGLSAETAGLSNITGKAWVITDNMGEFGTLTATDAVGTYTVEYNDIIYNVKATGTDTYVAEGTTLNIPVAGTYTVATARKQVPNVLYVSAGGSAIAEGTAESPFDTVASAIAAANDSGYGADDTVTIKLVGDSVDNGAVPAYEFDLVVTSADANTKTTLNVTTNTLTNNEGGDVLFSNVTIARATEHSYVVLNDSNATFESNVSFNFGYGTVLVVGSNTDGGGNKNVAGNTLIFNNATPIVSLSNFGWAGRTYTEDVNLVVNNASANARIWFNASYDGASNGTTVYDKNLNINLKDASAASFNYGAGVTVNGGLQIINSTDIAITSATAGIADVTGNKWIINNKLGAEDVTFTETAGTFNVNFDTANYYITITDAQGNVSRSSSTTLTVEPGEYTIEKVRIPKEASYTLSADGELASIEAAILKANEDGYIAGDTVTFFVSGETTVPFGATLTAPARLTDYEYKLIITTAEGEDRRTIGGEKSSVRLSGPTEFQNIKLDVNGTSSSYPTFGLGGNDVTFNPETSISGVYWVFATGQQNNSIDVKEAMDLYIGTALPGLDQGIKIGNSYTQNTYSNDVNITYNVANASQTFTFGTNDTEKTNFKKNVNFNLMAGTGFTFSATSHSFAEGSAIQVINSTNVAIDSTTGVFDELVDTAGNPVPKYIITNKTGKADAISFTENAGTYNLDIGAIKYDGYYAIITNNATNEVIHAKGDSVTLPAGEYTVTTGRDPWTKEYTITSGTLADAVQTAIDEGFGYGDNVTFNLGSLEEINIDKLPKYTFNLVIKSDVKTKLVMNNGNEIANNQGAHTHFKNVEIYKVDPDTGELGKWGTINLAGSSVTFDSDVVITTGGFCTLTYGVSADDNGAVVVDTEQKVVIDCPAPTYIALSSWNYAKRTYNDDVTLVINNRNTDSTILFNAYYNGAQNGTTYYLGNVNINVKQAKGIKFDYFEGIAPGNSTYVQLLVNGNTTINQEQVIELNGALGYDEMFYVVDKTFQRGVIDFTDEVGVYAVNTDYEASASVAQTFDPDAWEFVDVENGDTATADEANTVSIYNNDQYMDDWGQNFTNIWEIRTNEYFEDFNDTTIDELHDDWKFSSDSSAVTAETELTNDGMLHIVTQHNVKELPALNKNINISSKEQYISMDMKGNGFNYYNGLEILARLGGSGYAMDSYSFHLSSMFITLEKLNGNPNEKNVNGYYSYNTNGMETEDNGLWGRVPGGIDKNNTYTFNSNHTYRVSLSVTTAYEGENEIAYVRGIVVNLTTNQVVFDETFKDSQPYDGTEFAICSPDSGSNVYVDNVYFSTEKFRDGDEGLVEGDINGDGVYNVLDLVYVGEKLDGADHQIAVRNADLSGNGVIDENDIPLIRKEILGDVEIGKEFNLSGNSDAAANALRQQILNATSTLNGKVYTATNNGEVVLTHTIEGDIWYVSSEADGNGDGTSASTPWTLEQLQANTILDNSFASTTYKDCKVREGDAVLFERGSVFRTDNLLRDMATSGQETDSYSYLFMSEGTFYGAYTATQGANAGATAKPKFIDSVKNYADAEWTAVAGQENLYVIDAPELIMDTEGNERVENGLYAADNGATNIVFNGGAKVGQRKAFPDSARNGGKLYTIYKDGQFTTDVVNGKLYLYSEVDPSTYDSIEVSRPVQAIQVNSHEGNVIIDNLSFHGFARGTIGSSFGTNGLTVTNCDIGYSGGTFMGQVRGGNAIGGWCGGSSYKINHNWIYQTWDSAISPQGNTAISYDGFEVIGNLFEYNNCDIEIFDRGTGESVAESNSATWNNCDWSNNIMRFTTLGWGSREADKIRGIQGVIRGSFSDASVVDIDWTNNIIDSPGMEIFRLDNTTDYEQIDADTTKALAIFKFGQSYTEGASVDGSLFGNNTYYLNARLRKSSVVVRDYMTMTPEDYETEYGTTENISRGATTAAEFYNAITAVEDSNLWTEGNSHFFWGGVEVTSGN